MTSTPSRCEAGLLTRARNRTKQLNTVVSVQVRDVLDRGPLMCESAAMCVHEQPGCSTQGQAIYLKQHRISRHTVLCTLTNLRRTLRAVDRVAPAVRMLRSSRSPCAAALIPNPTFCATCCLAAGRTVHLQRRTLRQHCCTAASRCCLQQARMSGLPQHPDSHLHTHN